MNTTQRTEFNKNVTRQRGALTRAKKRGPGAVLDAAASAFESFDEHGWPDDWSAWQRAADDAQLTIQRERF